jgi:hypothetical protein
LPSRAGIVRKGILQNRNFSMANGWEGGGEVIQNIRKSSVNRIALLSICSSSSIPNSGLTANNVKQCDPARREACDSRKKSRSKMLRL